MVSRSASDASAVSSAPAPAKATLVPASAKASDIALAAHQSIRQVNLAQNGSATEVSISGSGPLSYHSIHLQNPDRLVLDFAGSHLTTTEKQIASNLDPVREIRLAQFTPEVSRVVIDLREPARYNIKGEGSTVTVSFEGKPSTGAGATSAPAADSANAVTTKSRDRGICINKARRDSGAGCGAACRFDADFVRARDPGVRCPTTAANLSSDAGSD